jgi:hypothetical protein
MRSQTTKTIEISKLDVLALTNVVSVDYTFCSFIFLTAIFTTSCGALLTLLISIIRNRQF